jgi:LPXTG-motif cell wall-anchored protein
MYSCPKRTGRSVDPMRDAAHRMRYGFEALCQAGAGPQSGDPAEMEKIMLIGRAAARGVMVLALALVPFSALVVAATPASAAAKCDISRFTNPDGSIDSTGYLQCFAPGVNPNTVVAGAQVTFTGGGCANDATVTITMEGVQLGTVVADGKGNFSATVTIPAGTSLGVHTLTASCLDPSGNPLTITQTITVVSAESTLPKTGTDVAEYVGLGLALIALGGAAVLGARRELAKHRTS